MHYIGLYVEKIQSFFIERVFSGLAGYLLHKKRFDKLLHARPFMIHVNIVNICNSNCSFCAYKFQTVPKVTMEFDLFRKIVDEYESMGGGLLSITPIAGEPLVTSDFLNYAKYLGLKKTIKVHMVTNGVLIDKFGADVLLEYIHGWQISMSGFSESMYRRLFNTDHYQRVRKNIINLLEWNAKRSEPRHIVISIRPDRPMKEVLACRDFQEILRYHPNITFTHRYSDIGGLIGKEDFTSPVKFHGKRYKLGFKCYVASRGLCVCPDGEVLACPCIEAINYPADLIVGNVKNECLADIWRGVKRRDFLETFKPFRSKRATCLKCKSYRPDILLYSRSNLEEFDMIAKNI